MKRKDWQSAYDPIPESLNLRVTFTLAHLEEEKPMRKFTLRTTAIVLALLIALCGIAYAAISSKNAELFGWLYGSAWQQDIEKGDIASPMLTKQLGDVTYTIEEVVFKKDGDFPGLYGVVRIAPAKGSKVVLLAEDYAVDDPAGYLVHYGTDETIPDDYLTYRDLAAQTDAKIVHVRASINSLHVHGQEGQIDFGESWLPQKDGTILGAWEAGFNQSGLERAESYDLSIHLSNWEVTPEGVELRDEPGSTQVSTDWQVTVKPEMKED